MHNGVIRSCEVWGKRIPGDRLATCSDGCRASRWRHRARDVGDHDIRQLLEAALRRLDGVIE